MKTEAFQALIWDFYKKHGRNTLPWRKTKDLYKILVSEIMLQQTQVDRVIPKYREFISAFPTLKSLAEAERKKLLTVWQGLGYNRRALHLKNAAETILKKHHGVFPKDYESLLALPGIGPATAGDLLAFAWNKPAIVIETNIRTVYIHHFFPDRKTCVSDKDLIPLIEKTMDMENPREWYYALMDYGSHLKKTIGNNIERSAGYAKQSKFKGSNRELRSNILKLILKKPRTEAEIIKLLELPAPLISKNLIALEKEGLITNKKGRMTA